MELTRNDLKKYMFNPELVQKQVLDFIEKSTKENYVITNPNSPFNLLLEATSVTSANAALETMSNIRSLYPDLSISINDLSKHLTDNEIDGMVSKPGDALFTFFINVTDLISNGYRPEKSTYVEMTIPTKTYIKIHDIVFTLLNDINVKLYDNGSIMVEYIQNDNINSIKDQNILPSGLTTNADGHRLIVFTCKVKQVKITTYNFTPTIAQGFNKILNLSQDYQFYHLDVWYRNNMTRNNNVKLNIKYNEDYINPTTPTAFIRFDKNDLNKGLFNLNKIGVFIPDIYFIEHGVGGNITLDVYETMGGVNVPLDKIPIQDFELVLGDTSKNHSSSVSTSISIIVMSNGVLTNGSSGLTFEEMKTSIINNSKGTQVIPITDHQLKYENKLDGMEVFKITDTVSDRTYIICKNLNKKPQKSIKALQDVFFNTVSILLEDYKNHDYVQIFEDNFIIKSGAIFKEKNSIIKLLTQNEIDELKLLSDLQKIEFYKKHKYFYTPFYYVISRKDRVTTSKVYYLDKPKITNFKIMNINQNIDIKANTETYFIQKIEDGYEISISLIKNEECDNYEPNEIKMCIAIPLVTKNKLFINGVYDEENDLYKFLIKSNMFIDENDRLKILNGVATTGVNYTDLSSTIETYIYVTDKTIMDDKGFLSNSIYGLKDDYVVLTHEVMDVSFGKRVKYIWDKLYIDYTERRYKKYDEDVFAYYDSNIYDKDPFTGFEFTFFNESDEYGIEYLKKHQKGDPILDEDGNHVILHKKGDIILQDNGLPLIDDCGGMVRNLDICMLEYEFKLSQDELYLSYNTLSMSELEEILFRLVPEKNNRLLEHTSLLYKSYKNSLPIIAKINNIYYSIPSAVSPTVKITYAGNEDLKINSNEISELETIVGGIIDEYFENSYIKLEELRRKIKEGLGNEVIAVQVTGIDPSNSEMLTFKDKTKRMSLKKKLELTEWNQLVVKYDVKINVEVV